MAEVEKILKFVLLPFQILLALWQFMKVTPLGALIQGTMGWSLRRFRRLSPTYARLEPCQGRVLKRLNCYVLQADISSEGTGIQRNVVNTITLDYFSDEPSQLRWEGNMLYINDRMSYYITPAIWEELRTLERVLSYGRVGPHAIAHSAGQRAAAARARADRAQDDVRESTDRAEEWAARITAINNRGEGDLGHEATRARAKAYARGAEQAVETERLLRAAADLADQRHLEACTAAAAAAVALPSHTVFLKGQKEFWEGVMTGGVMSLKEVLDGIILYNQHVSLPLNDDWLLPVDLSVSEEKLVKILNFLALFLQTDILADVLKVKIHWLISISILLTIVSALLEFSTRVRICVYTKVNVFVCYVAHSICDRLRRSWRRQIYSLGKWVENFKPCNDIKIKVVKGRIRAIITGGAKIDQEGATLVEWLDRFDEQDDVIIRKQFDCDPSPNEHIDMRCTYFKDDQICDILANTISDDYVKCESEDEFKRIITLVECMARNCSGSLISYGPNNKVRVRGFKQSIISYVKNGLPPVYELALENANIIVA